ncbi:MAG: deoxyhypusine synthase [Chrysiogenales bacterium]|nr:MAG: deoxyhypusine synthase [Chrysiogenales bacterium]
MNRNEKNALLANPVGHADFTSFDSRKIIDSMKEMSFSAREIATAAEIFQKMIEDPGCTIILTIAGSTGAAGCLRVYHDMIKYNMVDVVVATGAAVVDMDFFEALGFRHYRGSQVADDRRLRSLYIDRIYDTFIDEEELQVCDATVKKIADSLDPHPYSSREFISRMGEYLVKSAKKKESMVQTAHENGVPVFCPAFSDSSAGFGLVMHQHERPEGYVSIDSVRDLYELTQIKMKAPVSGLFMIGGGVPKNFAQDTVVCAELLGVQVPMHRYAVQITVADARDGGCSGSTLKEASSWGKVDTTFEQMVYAEATSVLPLIASAIYHQGDWKKRSRRNWAGLFDRRE